MYQWKESGVPWCKEKQYEIDNELKINVRDAPDGKKKQQVEIGNVSIKK